VLDLARDELPKGVTEDNAARLRRVDEQVGEVLACRQGVRRPLRYASAAERMGPVVWPIRRSRFEKSAGQERTPYERCGQNLEQQYGKQPGGVVADRSGQQPRVCCRPGDPRVAEVLREPDEDWSDLK